MKLSPGPTHWKDITFALLMELRETEILNHYTTHGARYNTSLTSQFFSSFSKKGPYKISISLRFNCQPVTQMACSP